MTPCPNFAAESLRTSRDMARAATIYLARGYVGLAMVLYAASARSAVTAIRWLSPSLRRVARERWLAVDEWIGGLGGGGES